MRTAIWKLKPKQSKYAEYSPNLAREEGLKYIEQLRKEDDVAKVEEKTDMFIIYLRDFPEEEIK